MNFAKLVRKLTTNRKGAMGLISVVAIIGTIVATAFGILLGSIILSETYDVAAGLDMGKDANETVEAMFDIIWPSMQLLPLVILVLVAVAIIAVVALIRG